jgi:hypothetical protein
LNTIIIPILNIPTPPLYPNLSLPIIPSRNSNSYIYYIYHHYIQLSFPLYLIIHTLQ